MADKIMGASIVLVIVVMLGFTIFANIKCWNVPYGDRTGFCALLNNTK